MTVRAGTVLGVYEVVSLIGRGAMGEVYRATDTRLRRDVAVKILPDTFRTDPDRLRRFEQEALAAARLNHPNVLAVYDIGSSEGVPYVVSELLEGTTLRELLTAGPLPVRKSVDYAVQIAEGLGAAHARNIVHRDLKPENLFVTADGRVKILDFGLAKLTERRSANGSNTPTMTLDSEPGLVVGTAAYMSPEQARGDRVDPRTDIFSLGAILYEMLSGRRAFKGETAADTLSAVLHDDPPPLALWHPNVPPSLDRAVQFCLEKTPEARFQSARDVALALRAGGDVQSELRVGDVNLPSRGHRYYPVVVLALLAAAVAGVGFLLGRNAAHVPVPTFQRLTFRRGTVTAARFAPDGRTIVYAAAWDGNPLRVFATRLESPESRAVVEGPVDLLGVSPSSELALLLDRRRSEAWVSTGTLARSPFDGGTPRPVLNDVQCAAWSPSGDLAVVRDVNGRNRLEAPAGHVAFETSGYITDPRFSPSGDLVAFIDHTHRAANEGTVRVITTHGDEIATSAGWTNAWGLAWRTDSEVWFTAAKSGAARGLYAMGRRGRVRLVARLGFDAALHDISPDGRVLVSSDDVRLGIIAQATGQPRERDVSWFDFSVVRDLSTDGHQMLFDETGDGGGPVYSVYLRTGPDGPPVRLGSGLSCCFAGSTEQVASIQIDRALDWLALLPTGAGEVHLFPEHGLQYQWVSCAPDGTRLVVSAQQPGRRPRLYVQETAGGPARTIADEGVSLVNYVNLVSPDSRAIVARGADGRFALYPLAGGTPQALDRFPADLIPTGFTPDGRALYVYRPGDLPAVVSTFDLESARLQPVHEMRLPDPAGIQFIRPPLIRAQGKAYAFSYLRVLSTLYLVDGLR